MDPEDFQDLLYCARFNELEDLKTLLDAKIDPNYRDEEGNTALFYSAANGHVDACKLLYDYGAEFTYNNYGDIDRAVLLKHIPVVQFLLQTYTNINVCQRNIFGKSPLDIALSSEQEELVNLLLNHPSAAILEEEIKKNEKDFVLNEEDPSSPLDTK